MSCGFTKSHELVDFLMYSLEIYELMGILKSHELMWKLNEPFGSQHDHSMKVFICESIDKE